MKLNLYIFICNGFYHVFIMARSIEDAKNYLPTWVSDYDEDVEIKFPSSHNIQNANEGLLFFMD